MSSAMKIRFEHPRDLLNLALAAVLFASPWVLGFASETVAAWAAWGSAIAIGVFALAALFVKSAVWADTLSLALSVWTVAAPWILGFAAVTMAFRAHIVVGVVLFIVATWEVWTDLSRRPAATA